MDKLVEKFDSQTSINGRNQYRSTNLGNLETEPSLDIKFKGCVIYLIRSLRPICERLTNEGKIYIDPDLNLFETAETMLGAIDRKDIITSFIHDSHLFWEKFGAKESRQEFIDNEFKNLIPKLFNKLPSNLLTQLNKVFADKLYTISEMDKIVKSIETMIKISIKYVHEQRGPKIISSSEGQQRCYEHHFLENSRNDINPIKFTKLYHLANPLKWE